MDTSAPAPYDKDIAWISIISNANDILIYYIKNSYVYWPGVSRVSTYRGRPVLPTKCQRNPGAIVSCKTLSFMTGDVGM